MVCVHIDTSKGLIEQELQLPAILKVIHWPRVFFVDGLSTYNGERDVQLGV